MKHFIGVDIGGTNVKFGLVNTSGELTNKVKFPTEEVSGDDNFIENFSKILGNQLELYPEVKKVGIGIPGTLSKDRKSALELPNIPALSNKNLIGALEKKFPKIGFSMDNDANAAALGEYYFGENKLPESYFFIALGTGVGGGAIINKKIFLGGDGNGMEIGHIVSGSGKTIEAHLGKKGVVKLAKHLKKKYKKTSELANKKNIDAKKVAKAAHEGDPLALEVYEKFGIHLAEALIAGIRILDIKTIVIGGGVSETYNYVKHSMFRTLEKHLTPYYLKDLKINIATLSNEAGIIGAASLCFIGEE